MALATVYCLLFYYLMFIFKFSVLFSPREKSEIKQTISTKTRWKYLFSVFFSSWDSRSVCDLIKSFVSLCFLIQFRVFNFSLCTCSFSWMLIQWSCSLLQPKCSNHKRLISVSLAKFDPTWLSAVSFQI